MAEDTKKKPPMPDPAEAFAAATQVAANIISSVAGASLNSKPRMDKKAIDHENFDPDIRDQIGDMPIEVKLDFSGIGGGQRLNGDVPAFIKTPAERVIKKGNAFIVLGVDRPGGPDSGFGGLGNTHCAAIDLVAGRMGARAAKKDKKRKKIFKNPDFTMDAARVYISQKSDIDTYMGPEGLADVKGAMMGTTSYDEPRSAVGLKADAIRIVGREGIKLITKTDTQNSQGGEIMGNPGIDLIALNDDSDMQPLVKGDNLVAMMKETLKLINSLRELLYNFVTFQKDFNSGLMNHTHFTKFYGSESSQSPQSIQAAIECMIDTVEKVEIGINKHMMATTGVKLTYLQFPFAGLGKEAEALGKSGAYINSTYNYTN